MMISAANIPQKHTTQGFWMSCLKPIPLFCIKDTKWLSERLFFFPCSGWSVLKFKIATWNSKSMISKENRKKEKKKIKAQNFDPLVGDEKGTAKPQSGP